MTRDQAIDLARTVVEAEVWPWMEPIEAILHRRWFFGASYWVIETSVGMRGCNIRVEIDDETRRVVHKGSNPR